MYGLQLEPSELTPTQMRALVELSALGTERTEHELIQLGVDIAEWATDSRIAYLHFLNADQTTIELGIWSHETLARCTAVHDRHYPVEKAGIWADSVRSRAPCLHNDFPHAEHRKGVPDGHVEMTRHLGVPIIVDGLVRLLLGVGNKDAPYDERDIRTLQLVGRRIWQLVDERRHLEHYLDLEHRFRQLQRAANVTAWDYDVDEDRFTWDDMGPALLGTRHATELPATLHQFLAFVRPDDQDAARRALAHGTAGQRFDLQFECRRASGTTFQAELHVEFRAREVGTGTIGIGTLQDVSERVATEDLRQRAVTDALTGLPNRRRLQEFFAGRPRGRRGEHDRCAFLYVDLDGFKPVNDTHGHAIGDDVLRIVAQRLRHVVRRDDLVVRLGGDEFAVLQTGVAAAEDAEVLAAKVIEACGEPIAIGDVRIVVGASVGVAVCPADACALNAIAERADRALYRAKQSGKNTYVVAE